MVKKALVILAFLGIALLVYTNRHFTTKSSENKIVTCDLDSIVKRGRLIAVTDFNSTDYYIYKGEPMGFNYELLKSFTDEIGLDLEIVTENQIDKAINMLNSGHADILAYNLTVNSSHKNEMLFTSPLGETKQVLVQRKPDKWKNLTQDEIDRSLIRNQIGLAGKTIYVQAQSLHTEQIKTLTREIGDSVNIIEVPFGTEQLIRNVANNEIDYTVCDENAAQIIASYYPNIDVSTPVTFSQNFAWGMRKDHSDKLQSEINRWLRSYKLSGSYDYLYAKYFRNTQYSSIVKSDLYALNTGKVSVYDDIIKRLSISINWDWRLLAALICQESHFNPKVVSYSGAIGLMQVMPQTGREYGIDIASSPENNIRAGIKYIGWLHSIFNPMIPDEKERIKFILAAYNAGPGHVIDAMNLAEKNGMNPQKWAGSVALWLLKKSEPQYYTDTVVKNGYYKGTESVNFVSQIMNRFEQYKSIIPDQTKHPF